MSDWIFLRGLVREAAHWGDFPDAFRAAFPGAHVTFVDLPGNGIHYRDRTPSSVAAMTGFVRAEAATRGVRRPHLLALSLGGMIACDWAQRYPEELSGVVLINTSFGGYSPPHQRFRLAAAKMTIASLRERDSVRRERCQLEITSNRPEAYDATAARWAGVARARPVSKTNALRQLLAAARFRPPSSPPSVPHLLLCGHGDRLVDPRCSRAIARRWGCALAVHPTGGHDLSLDAGPWMLTQLSAWLEGRPVA